MTGDAVGRHAVTAEPSSSDHACRGYESAEERAQLTCDWLVDGLTLGQRGMYVGDLSHDELIGELAALPGRDEALASGALAVASSSDVYDLLAPIVAEQQLALYAGVVDQAIADGYRGVRVAADITPLVTDPSRRPAHLHWEQYADRYIAERPLAPLCMYDEERVLGIDGIVCVHPLHDRERFPFGLHATSATTVALDGELDILTWRPLRDALAAMPATDTAIDIAELDFMDRRSAQFLHDEVQRRRARGQSLVLTGARPLHHRVWELCGFDSDIFA